MRQYDATRAIINETIDLDVKSIRKSNVFTNIEDWRYMNFATVKDMMRQATNIADMVIRVKAVYTSNVSLTTCPNTTDGITIVNNDIVLLANQTNQVQNGVYTWATGGNLTRISTLNQTATTALRTLGIGIVGINFHILQGNLHENCLAYLDSSVEQPIIDVDTIQIRIYPNLKVSSASNNLITTNNGRIEVKLKNTGDDVFGGLKYDPITKEIYITQSEMPGAAGGTIIYYLGAFHSQPNIQNYKGNVGIANGGVGITDLDFGLQNIFGSGEDGDTVVGNGTVVNLTQNANYRNLIVNEGGVINTNGFAIFVLDKLTNNGQINCNGASPSFNAAAAGIATMYVGGSGGSNVAVATSLGGNGGGNNGTLPANFQGGIQGAYVLANMLTASTPSPVAKYTGGSGGLGTTNSGAGGGVMLISAKYIEGNGGFNALGGDAFAPTSGTKYGGGGGAILINTYSNLHNNSLVSFRVQGGRGNSNANSGTRGNVICNQIIDNILFDNNPVLQSVSGVVRRNGTATITVTGQNLSYLTDYDLGLNRSLWGLEKVKRTTINTVELTFSVDSSVSLGTTTISATNKVRNNSRTSNTLNVTIAEGAPFISTLSVNEMDFGATSNIVVTGSGFDVGTTFTVANNPGLTINTTTFNSATQMTINVTVSSNEVEAYKMFQLVASNANGNSGISGYNKLFGRYPYIVIDTNAVGVRSYPNGTASDYTRAGNTFTRVSNNSRVGIELLLTAMRSLLSGYHDFQFTVQLTTPPSTGLGVIADKRYGWGEKTNGVNGVYTSILNNGSDVFQVDGGNINITNTETLVITALPSGFFSMQRNGANAWRTGTVSSLISELNLFFSTYLASDTIVITDIRGRFKQA